MKSIRSQVYPQHTEKLLRWSRTRVGLELPASVNMSIESDDTIVPESTNGACSLPSFKPAEKSTPVEKVRLFTKKSLEVQADLEEFQAEPIANPSCFKRANTSSTKTGVTSSATKRRVFFDTPSWIDLSSDEFSQSQSPKKEHHVTNDLSSSTQSTAELEARPVTSSVGLKSKEVNYGAIPKKLDFSPGSESETIACRGTQPLDHEVGIVATFVWCDTPASIFFRTSELTKKYHQIRDLVKRQFRNIKPQTNPSKLRVGFACVVYNGFDWWRAEVINTDAYPECTVSFMDKGYQRIVQAIDIHPMTPELQMFPRTVLQVSLWGVYPPPVGVWDDKVAK